MLIKEIVEATSGQLLKGDPLTNITGFTQDSRKCQEGMMYIPIIGEVHDGHDFIESAFENHASATLTDRVIDGDGAIILVEDTLKALGDMARYVRTHHDVKVVGITGSVGKTSTKDMIYSVVSQHYKALKTLGNYNNEVGLPLTILRYKDEEVMVIEMGMNHLKEIDYLTKIALPDIACITNVGTAHIGEVGSREKILEAKMEITHGLDKSGLLIINHDNDMLQKAEFGDYKVKTVGITTPSDMNGYDITLYDDSSDFKLDYEGNTYKVHVPVPGQHFVMNALIGISVGLALDIPVEECIRGIETFELTQGRSDTYHLKDNITLYDGTYNANLDSMNASIDVLSKAPNRKIAIIGDMLELGEYEKELHESVGQHLKEKDIDVVLCVGQATKYMESLIPIKHFDSNASLMEALDSIIKPDDTILVKGSNGMRLKEVVAYIRRQYS